jgi:dipeptidyl aminopeptidase/acylaminoacyl peptidase
MPRLLRALLPAATAMLLAIAPAMTAAPPQSAVGRPLAIEDYYRIKSVGSPLLSPDAAWVAFTVSTRLEEAPNANRSEGYLVPADASAPPRRLHDGKEIAGLRWLDDGWLQYTADEQQWKINPSQASAAPTSIGKAPAAGRGGRGGGRGRGAGAGRGSGAVASPDGKWEALTVPQPEPAPPPSAASDFEKRHEDRFQKAGSVTFDWKDFQRDGQPFPAPNPTAGPASHVVLQPAGGGARKALIEMDLRPSGLVWHPNGQLLAFTADEGWRNELKYNRADLWTVTIDGKVTRLTNDGYVHSDADFSPDGKYLSYTRSFGTDMIIEKKLDHGGPRDIYIRPVAGSEPINLTANWDLDPGQAQWSPDSRFLYYTAGIGGETHLFRVPVPSGKVEQVTRGARRLGGLTIDKSFKTIVYTIGVHEAPPDIYAANIDGTNERRLTDMHRAFTTEVALSKADRLRWPSYDGTQIEGWLMFPHGYDPKKGPYPLIVFSHGGPHSATGYSFNFKEQYFAANGYFILDTNFRSSTGYGDAFKWATWGEWGRKDGEDVMSGVDYALKRYPIDPKRVGHTGHSYGGFITNWIITQYPDRFAAAITGAGISNWISDYGTADIYRTKETEFFGPPWDAAARERMIKQSPLTYADRVRTPTLFVHGEVDQRVPYEEAEQMYFALKRRGVPAKMIRYKDQPHGIGGHWNNVHRMLNELKWWNQYLKGSGTTTTSAGGDGVIWSFGNLVIWNAL